MYVCESLLASLSLYTMCAVEGSRNETNIPS